MQIEVGSEETTKRLRHAEVLEVLYPLFLQHRMPIYLGSDNAPEFIARNLLAVYSRETAFEQWST